ncbi:MAG: hypothetical protein ACPLTR_10635 [Thermacetogeniaceae bacterium]
MYLDKCVKCNSCMVACPPQYKAVVKVSPPIVVEKGDEQSERPSDSNN